MTTKNLNKKNIHRQVVIIGGGLVGGLTALLFAKDGVQATVLDASPLLDEKNVLNQPNSRVLAINQASMKLMQYAEIWQNLQRVQPYSGMQVWHKDGVGQLDFGQASEKMPLKQHWLGCMVEPSILNLAIQQQLLKKIENYQYQVQVQRIEQMTKGWKIYFKNQQGQDEMITTDLLIAADGANSFVRQNAMIDIDVLDYHQTALSGAIRVEKSHQYVARQIFLPTGPLAFLPMKSIDSSQDEHWISFVWTLPSDLAEEYAQLSSEKLLEKLNHASHYMLGEIKEVQNIASFPLKARQAKQYIKENLALIGDAAHVIHPLAGQGVNLGCLDAGILVDCLLKEKQRGTWASQATLHQYQQIRRRHNSLMMHSMSVLNWLNKSQFRPLQWLRSEGVNFVAKQPLAIKFFTQQASGLGELKGTKYL